MIGADTEPVGTGKPVPVPAGMDGNPLPGAPDGIGYGGKPPQPPEWCGPCGKPVGPPGKPLCPPVGNGAPLLGRPEGAPEGGDDGAAAALEETAPAELPPTELIGPPGWV